MLFGTTAASVAVVLLLGGVHPAQAGIIAPSALLISLGLVIIGVLTIIGLLVRMRLSSSRRLLSQQVRISFRQSILSACIVLLGLLLSHLQLFAWWNMLLALCALGIAEYFFLSSESDGGGEESERHLQSGG